MASPLQQLQKAELSGLREVLRSGRVSAPYAAEQLVPLLGSDRAEGVASELTRLRALGMGEAGLDAALELLDGAPRPAAMVVWSGPEGLAAKTQDTGVAVRQLFGRAERRVLVAGFAVYQGREVFKALAARMDEAPQLRVDMYLNVERRPHDTTIDADLLRRFVERFRAREWPGERVPRVYYDPRSLALLTGKEKRATLHAKCVVVDGRHVLVTSANFTEAAQERNIELGLALEDAAVAATIEEQFEWLVARGRLLRVAGL